MVSGDRGGTSLAADLSSFPITGRWPATHPERLHLYSINTPNGVKASIMLEEIGLPFETHRVRFDANDQMSDSACAGRRTHHYDQGWNNAG